VKFQGVQPATFYLHIKEGEFRDNHSKENLYRLVLKMIRDNLIKLS